jgi:hypothetical protein
MKYRQRFESTTQAIRRARLCGSGTSKDGVLGYWRKDARWTDLAKKFMNHSLEEYDRLHINGIELRLTSTR